MIKKKSYILELVFKQIRNLILIALLSALTSCSNKPEDIELAFRNNLDIERRNEVIHINCSSLKNFPLDDFSVVDVNKESVIPYQLVDKDKDGVSDELVLLCDFSQNETKKVRIVKSPIIKNNSEYTDVFFSLRSDSAQPNPKINDTVRPRGFIQDIKNPVYQLEGPALENNKVAFRTFFDTRNGKDIYGKTIENTVLKSIGLGESWHKLRYWGMDILQVGQSLGAGGLGVVDKDTLYRLGDADLTKYQEICDGPFEASFRLDFTGWDAGNKKINGYELLSLAKDKHYYKNEICLSDTSLILAIGLPGFKCRHTNYIKHNGGFSSIYTYGPQAADTDTRLGLAILFDSEQYLGHDFVEDNGEIQKTHYVMLRPQPVNHIYFFACWELSDSTFSEEVNFIDYLQEEANKLFNPIITTL